MAGNGGDGGVGVQFTASGPVTFSNTYSITGGNGGSGGTATTTSATAGTASLGGAGIVGANLAITNSGTITGGMSGDGTTQADAIDFTGGTNSLTLNATTANGGLTGGLGLGGMVTIDPGTTTTLTSVLHDYGTATGAFVKVGAGTLTLSAANTYTGGTTLAGGTLELAAQGAAGTGTLSFDGADTTLQIDAAALGFTQPFPGNIQVGNGSYSGVVTGFGGISGEVLQLSSLVYIDNGRTSATLNGTTLTVTNGASSDTLTNFSIGPGLTTGYYTFAASRSKSNTGTKVTISLNAPSAPTLTAGQDTGTSSTDRLTDINTPTLTGTGADSNSTITLYDGSGTTAIGSGTSDGNGNYTAKVTTALADGQHSITATVTDAGNDVSARSAATSITVDTTLSTPTIAFATSNSAAGAADVNAAHTTTAGYTVENVDSDATATVTFTGRLKSGAAGTVTGAGTNGTHSVDLSGFRDGTVTASISDADTAGNMRTGTSVQATLDTTPPTITALADSGPGIDANGNGDLNAGKTVTLTVTTSEPVYVTPGQGGTTPTLTLNDGGIGTYTGGSGTTKQTFSYTVAAGQNVGNLAVYQVNANGAAATDAAGNPLAPSILDATVPTGTLQIDTTAPTYGQGTAMPAAGNDLGAGKVVTFTVPTSEPVTVTEANGGTPTLQLDANGEVATYTGTVGQPVSALTFSYTVQPGDNAADLTAGPIVLPTGTTVQDGAGNNADPSTFRTIDTGIQIDTMAPRAPGVSLTSDTGASGTDGITANPALTVTPAEAGGTLFYSADGGAYSTTAPAFATDGSADERHTVSVEQQDGAGNVSTPGSVAFTLDDTKPAVTIAGPGGNTTVASQTVSGTVADANPGATVSLYDNGSATAFATAVLQPGGTWSTTVTLAQGANSIVAQDTDLAGNTGSSAATTYTLGSVPAVTERLAQDTGASASDGITSVDTVTGTADPGATVSFTVDGKEVATTTMADGTGAYSYTPAGLADGQHTIVASEANGFGTGSSPSVAFTLDTTPPAASSVTDTVAQGSGPTAIGLAAPSDNLTPAGNLAIVAGNLPSDGIVTLANGTAVVQGQALSSSDLTGLLFTPTGTAGQSSAFTYTVTDTAGNASQGTATLNVGAPTTPDAVSISPDVSYDNGVFTLFGTASSTAGVPSVEISAVVDGVRQDLGPATVAANGTFTFQDAVGAHTQTFFVAAETDALSGQATSQDPGFNLMGGIGPGGGYGAQQNFDATEQVSTAVFRPDGGRSLFVQAADQTVDLHPLDVVYNQHQGGTTFVFSPGDEVAVVRGLQLRGTDHDTLILSGADFGNSIAEVLRNTRQSGNASIITDPKTGDQLGLVGVSKAELRAYQNDFTFHA